MGCAAYRNWLVDVGSLTQRLQARCQTFAVTHVIQYWGHPQPDEAALLGMRRQERALLREVRLCCDGIPVVFARSVLPRRSLRGKWHQLGQLGTRPLGVALFANPSVIRTPLLFRKLLPRHASYRRAISAMSCRPSCLWARRSVFMLNHAPILVTEIFLPGVLEL